MDALILMTKFAAPIQFWPKKHVAYVVWRGLSLDTKFGVCFFSHRIAFGVFVSACRMPWRCQFYAILITHKIAGFDVENMKIIHDSAHDQPC
jgi:hypothetical protein